MIDHKTYPFAGDDFSFIAHWLAHQNFNATFMKIGREMAKLSPASWAFRQGGPAEREDRREGSQPFLAPVCKHESEYRRASEKQAQTSQLAAGQLHKGLLSFIFHSAPEDENRQARGRYWALTASRTVLDKLRSLTMVGRTEDMHINQRKGPLEYRPSTRAVCGSVLMTVIYWVLRVPKCIDLMQSSSKSQQAILKK